MKLFVGLGNPGEKYEDTRHNIGFKVIDALVDRFRAYDVSKQAFLGLLYKKDDLLFLKPSTFMNLSGKSVLLVKNFYKIDIGDVVVIHDDIDLPFGALRIKQGGGSGGHNGLKSIDTTIGNGYVRVRMGVGKPEAKHDVAEYVLSAFLPEERECMPGWIRRSTEVCEALTKDDLSRVASRYSVKSIEAICP